MGLNSSPLVAISRTVLSGQTCPAAGSRPIPYGVAAERSPDRFRRGGKACAANIGRRSSSAWRIGLSAHSSISGRFREIADEVGAKLLVEHGRISPALVAGGRASPARSPHAHVVHFRPHTRRLRGAAFGFHPHQLMRSWRKKTQRGGFFPRPAGWPR